MSVKDRIRNLQQSANVQPSISVAERTKAVELVSHSDDDPPRSLSQLKEQFDSTVTTESASGLGARVARFDSDTSQSLQDRVRRLESGATDTGSLAARASAFERPGGSVQEVAGQFTEQEEISDGDSAALRKAREMFEAGTKDNIVETTLSSLKISSESGNRNVGIINDSAKISTTKVSQPEPLSSETTSQEAVSHGVSHRAAMFERVQSEPQSKTIGLHPTQRDPPKSLPSLSSAQRGDTSATNNTTAPKETEEKSLKDELREVKRANEELVSMLLELTTAFRQLESTRDELQKRITELEKK